MKQLLSFFLFAMLLPACTQSTDEILSSDDNGAEPVIHTIALNFDGCIEAFDGVVTRATTTFDNGTTMYITFSNGAGSEVHGTAVYDSTAKNWTMTYTGNLTSLSNASCTLYYFVNPSSTTSSSVSLSHSSASYSGTGTYTKTATSLSVTATLSPCCSRIRFKGTSGKTISVTGFASYSAFNKTNGELTNSSSSSAISLTVQSTGYTPYIYYMNCANSISLANDGSTYTMEATPAMQTYTGKSGYLTIPTATSNSGWEISGTGSDSNAQKRTFTANGVSFDMILVEHGTFTMGATAEQGSDAYDDEKPTHQVTLTNDYYIGETEVTQALWRAVTGYSLTSSYGKGNNYPAYYISYNDVLSFITKLNTLTGKTFRMPTEAEWEYAARGGNKSKGYKYSGSNTIGDVAWSAENSNSTTHQVKTKLPNELGIYDMSGNVYEWCSDWTGGYSSSSQTNPTGPNIGSYRVHRGGGWDINAGYCRSSCRFNSAPDYRNISLGLRLALSQ